MDCRVNIDINNYYDSIDELTNDFEMMLCDEDFKKAYDIYCKRVGGLASITEYDLMQIEKIKRKL